MTALMEGETMTSSAIHVGIIGCGNISRAYLQCLNEFKFVHVTTCADLDSQAARALASEFDIPAAESAEKLLARDDIQLVINLTPPAAHAEVSLAILAAGKHLYSEKPLAMTREAAREILATARERELRVGGAPDTFLEGNLQLGRRLIDEGWIGKVIGGVSCYLSHGHEGWHPNPDYYYRAGAGPLFDMGPYYLTALVNFFGPVRSVYARDRTTYAKRNLTTPDRFGEQIPVEVPTHIAGMLEFENDVLISLITSFDVWKSALPDFELHGTLGTLRLGNLGIVEGNTPFEMSLAQTDAWTIVPHSYGTGLRFGGGVAEMASALLSGRPHRAQGDMAYHVLDVLLSLSESARDNRVVEVTSTCTRPEPLPAGLLKGTFDRLA